MVAGSTTGVVAGTGSGLCSTASCGGSVAATAGASALLWEGDEALASPKPTASETGGSAVRGSCPAEGLGACVGGVLGTDVVPAIAARLPTPVAGACGGWSANSGVS